MLGCRVQGGLDGMEESSAGVQGGLGGMEESGAGVQGVGWSWWDGGVWCWGAGCRVVLVGWRSLVLGCRV